MNLLKWFLRTPEKEPFPDKLVNEPTREQILAMPLPEEILFVQNARMDSDCKPDETRNRARVRACYLINEAYKKQEKQR
jgi:hypothetical protein